MTARHISAQVTAPKSVFTEVLQIPEQTNASGLTCETLDCVRSLRAPSSPTLLNSLPSDLHAHHLHPGHLSFGSAMPHLSHISALSLARAGPSTMGSFSPGFTDSQKCRGLLAPMGQHPSGASPGVHAAPHSTHGTAPLLLYPTEHLVLATTRNEEQG